MFRGRAGELGAFLRARRDELRPEEVGLTVWDEPRRVPGLRREEVAELASISTDYYTRIEQARIAVTPSVLAAVASALRLDVAQRHYVFGLLSQQGGEARRPRAQCVQPQLRRLLDGLPTIPALVLGRYMDVLAWNHLASVLVTDFARIPRHERNWVRLIFLDPRMRKVHADWEDVARQAVAQLRMEASANVGSARLRALVGELAERDAAFRAWWSSYEVAIEVRGTTMLHPTVGTLELESSTLASTIDPDQRLVSWTARPGSRAGRRLRALSELPADVAHGVPVAA
ncbi:helix-turn-helix domain-containing protein [Streptomyces sp. NPDC095613]|uniref:helix-turn-helix domain-containing protein n=1 Tax=Streptomyces sp. NPDC095613 TaxID=3155540 RepID=UPI00331CF4CF